MGGEWSRYAVSTGEGVDGIKLAAANIKLYDGRVRAHVYTVVWWRVRVKGEI